MQEDGTVEALWLSYPDDFEYRMGFPTPGLLHVIDEVRNGGTPHLRILGVATEPLAKSDCRHMGVSEAWIERAERENHQLFMVGKADADASPDSVPIDGGNPKLKAEIVIQPGDGVHVAFWEGPKQEA